MVTVHRPTGIGASFAERPVLDINLLLLLFLVALGLCLRAAVHRDQDAERAEIDAQEGAHVGRGLVP